MSEKLITIQATQSRRLLAAVFFGVIGCLMMFVTGLMFDDALPKNDVVPTATVYSDLGPSIIMGLFGLFIIWLSIHSYRATAEIIYLTREGLFTGSGKKIFDIDNIASVDLSAPNTTTWLINGFTIELKEPMPRGLDAGLWVRNKTRVGFAPAISRKQGEAMSDMIKSLLISEGFEETYEKNALESEEIISEALATLKVSQFRRLFGVLVCGVWGFLLVAITGLIIGFRITSIINISHISLSMTDNIVFAIVLSFSVALITGVSGILVLQFAIQQYRTSDETLYLTHKSLFSSSGRKVCDIDNIASMDAGGIRSSLSNGLSITLKEPMPFDLSLGLWTRRKTRVRLGPLVSRKQSEAMSDMIKSLLSTEDRENLDEAHQAQS